MKAVTRILLVAATVPVVVGVLIVPHGCGSGVGSSQSTFDRITPELRGDCPGLADVGIASFIVAAEVNREEGFTRNEQLLGQGLLVECPEWCSGCPDDLTCQDCFEDCFICAEAILDVVYR